MPAQIGVRRAAVGAQHVDGFEEHPGGNNDGSLTIDQRRSGKGVRRIVAREIVDEDARIEEDPLAHDVVDVRRRSASGTDFAFAASPEDPLHRMSASPGRIDRT